MRYTNKFFLPDIIVRAAYVNDDRYDKGKSDRSVTQLISPPRIDTLRKAHFNEIEKDISEEWFALFGSAVHSILEMGAGKNDLVEERLFYRIDGWVVSGKADLQEYRDDRTVSVSDYKVTTAIGIMSEETVKAEWEGQLNLLAFLLVKNRPDWTVKDLSVIAIIRDWQRSQAAIDPLYPVAPIVRIKVPLWSMKKQTTFLRERVAEHRAAAMLHELGEEMPECSDADRWMRNSTWAIMKQGGKKAARVYDTEHEALDDIAGRKAGYCVVYRPGKSVRCEGNYCGVNQYCDQWARMKTAQAQDQDNGGDQTETQTAQGQ